ncbi:hypothetical protein [Mycobacteroides abscessus]|uniref:hypothetical protein n=1 Tax=Mycobacteroides abscessus TaxID=36809 RepID=UPI001E50FA57
MRVTRSDRFGGLSAETAREVMRWFSSSKPDHILCDIAQDDGRSTFEIASALTQEGWLELDHVSVGGESWWKATISGNALAQASFRRPITRATADKHVREVVDRARAFNADPAHLAQIVEVVVFGSYLDPTSADLGDVDFGVTVHLKIPPETSKDDRARMILDYATASGRTFSTFFDRLYWPQQQAIQALKNRSSVISITIEDVRALTDRWKVLYQLDEQPGDEGPT